MMEITQRPYQLSDVDDFMEWANDDQVIRSSRLRHYTTNEDALTYLQEEAIPHPWYRAICLDDHPIGFVSVKPGSDHQRCRGLISYALGSKYCGKGITTVAVPFVFEEFPDMQRLQAIVDVDNKASEREYWKRLVSLRKVFLEKMFLSRERPLMLLCIACSHQINKIHFLFGL
ncbi:hypothetical protein EZV62_000662 [Acer yangbiense]|uniref:N-acetyltransferase domain-containing protein n=1 Tax=Acer yangbiense TaxID=1000413 RepID=A0A5C7IRS0_9ROSI|nr:hypothetical protein EZV62_000662 [Acer yangbiense]